MPTKTIASFAVIKVNWDTDNIDYIENYVPFFVHLAKKFDYRELEPLKIQEDFEKEFSLKLPYHPIVTILKRLIKRGYAKRDGAGLIVPVNSKIVVSNFEKKVQEQERKINQIIKAISKYAQDKFFLSFNKEEIESAFLNFLSNNDLPIIFSSDKQSLSAEKITISKIELPYIVARFVYSIKNTDQEIFGYILDIAIGQLLAYTILDDNISSYQGKLRGTNYYLDTSLLFYLLGLNGKPLQDVYVDFVNILTGAGANLFVFRHTYEEYQKILNSDLKWLEEGNYNYSLASRTLRYFIDNESEPSDIEDVINNSEEKLAGYGIHIVDKPGFEDTRYLIGEDDLEKTIVDTYKESNHLFRVEDKLSTIAKDITSISAIFRLRKGHRPISLPSATHTLVTTNATLAEASRRFVNGDSVSFCIPPCLNDLLLGTLVWLHMPHKVLEMERKKIIACAYSAVQPSEQLVIKYLATIKKLKEQGNIDDKQFYLLRTSRVARNILGEKTFGATERLTEETPREIIFELEKKFKQESDEAVSIEQAKHEETKKILDDSNQSKKKITSTFSSLKDFISRVIAWGAYTVTALMSSFVIIRVDYFKTENKLLSVVYITIALASILGWFDLFRIKNIIKRYSRRTLDYYFPA